LGADSKFGIHFLMARQLSELQRKAFLVYKQLYADTLAFVSKWKMTW